MTLNTVANSNRGNNSHDNNGNTKASYNNGVVDEINI